MYSKCMTTNDLLRRSCLRHAKKTALIDGEDRFSYQTLRRESNRIANALINSGVSRGERVAIVAKDCSEFVFLYMGCSKIGAVFVPLNYRCVARELTYMLTDCNARTLFFGADYAQTVAEMKEHLPGISDYIAIGECDLPFATTYDRFILPSDTAGPVVKVEENDECAIIYTSGTTGKPKGAVITHRTRVSCTVNMLLDGFVEEEGIYLVGSPLFHTGALNIGLLPPLTAGATIVIMAHLHPKEIAESLQRERATHLLTVPTILNNLLEAGAFETYDFTTLRRIYYGGSSMSLKTLKMILDRLPHVKLSQGYGQTESTQLTVLRPEYQLSKIGCTGKAHLLVDLRVVNEQEQDVEPGETGEIITRGPHVMKGYLNIPDENEKAFKGGWFHTGDIARLDEDGFLTIVDRKKDLIISGGENIYPKEIEDVLHTHDKIKEVVVFGIPDEKWGETVCAAVVLKDGASLTGDEVIQFCRENLAGYKKPRKVVFRKDFPKNSLGKVLKDVLKKEVFNGI